MPGKIEGIIASLSPIERAVAQHLNLSVDEIAKKAKLDKASVRRALDFLGNKGIISTKIKKSKQVVLGDNGVIYLKQELPERRFLNLLAQQPALMLGEAKAKSGLSDKEFSVALGVLKAKAFIQMLPGKIILKAKKEELGKKMLEEKLLEALPLDFAKLSPELSYALKQLQKRADIIRIEEKKELSFKITSLGKKVIANLAKVKAVAGLEQLSPAMLKTGAWKGKQFRRYDLTTKPPAIYGGKRQPYSAFLQEVREKLVALGFEEMTGSAIVNEFWNYDALFQPQFHVAREWSATYYVKNKLLTARLPAALVAKVKKIHEAKWKMPWKLAKAQQLIMRPQCTVLSALTLASKPKIPSKHFAIARVYRPDVVDASHLTEFDQAEGIIIDHSLNLRNLFGILGLFAREIAEAKEVKFVPGYFPFTEPSLEVMIKHPKLGWIEVAGAGIFRKEVVQPLLGKDVTVLAWGIGITRLAMLKLGINDIRELFSQDLRFLRSR